jgi:SNF2 family DNA or RNA helicase
MKMKWLIINTEAFSPKQLKQKKKLSFTDLPWIVQRFLSAYTGTNKPFVILDESSRIKTNTPMKEEKKSSRTRLIKLLGRYVKEKCIMTATVMSKSPLNLVDQYDFLRNDYLGENMWQLAEKYCIMITLYKGRRVVIPQKVYEEVRQRLKNAYIRGGEMQLETAKYSIFKQYAIDFAKQEHIIQNRKYTPHVNKKELLSRIAPDTIFIKREDVFDIKYDKFVKEPIMRYVELPVEAKNIANELIELGFTDKITLGKVPALELQIRLQDICNGFEPIDYFNNDKKTIHYKPFKTNVKIDALLELLDEIDVENNQVAVWSSRKLMLQACADAFNKAEISYVKYDGDTKDKDKIEAEAKFKKREVQIFLANQASGAYGLNCLAQCSYLIFICVDGSVEKFYQTQHRALRGQLAAPKFAYAICCKGTVEERQWESLRVGQELIGAENYKETFIFK